MGHQIDVDWSLTGIKQGERAIWAEDTKWGRVPLNAL